MVRHSNANPGKDFLRMDISRTVYMTSSCALTLSVCLIILIGCQLSIIFMGVLTTFSRHTRILIRMYNLPFTRLIQLSGLCHNERIHDWSRIELFGKSVRRVLLCSTNSNWVEEVEQTELHPICFLICKLCRQSYT